MFHEYGNFSSFKKILFLIYVCNIQNRYKIFILFIYYLILFIHDIFILLKCTESQNSELLEFFFLTLWKIQKDYNLQKKNAKLFTIPSHWISSRLNHAEVLLVYDELSECINIKCIYVTIVWNTFWNLLMQPTTIKICIVHVSKMIPFCIDIYLTSESFSYGFYWNESIWSDIPRIPHHYIVCTYIA